MFDGREASGIFAGVTKGAAIAVVILILVALVLGVIVGRASAHELALRSAYALAVERDDNGEMYAQASITLDLPLTSAWSVVFGHEQDAAWTDRFGELLEHRRSWNAGLLWRPAVQWSVGLGRRWEVDNGGPHTYLKVRKEF